MFLIEKAEKIAAVVCRPFQKRAVITGSYGRKNLETPTIKLTLRGEEETTQRLPAGRTKPTQSRRNVELNGVQVKL